MDTTDIISSGFTVEYVVNVTGGVSNAQYYTSGQSPYFYTMTLLQGWNLVSTPIIPDDPKVTSIFGDNGDVILPVYSWSTTDRKYNEDIEIELGKGYWVLALNDTDVTFSGTHYSG